MKDIRHNLLAISASSAPTGVHSVHAFRISTTMCAKKVSAQKDLEQDCKAVSKMVNRDTTLAITSKALISHVSSRAIVHDIIMSREDISHASSKAIVHAITTMKGKASSHISMIVRATNHAKATSRIHSKVIAHAITITVKKVISHVKAMAVRVISSAKAISHVSREDSVSHVRISTRTRNSTSSAALITARIISIRQCRCA